MAKRYELSDASWEVIEVLITQDQKTGRPRNNDGLMLNVILWLLCSGAAVESIIQVSRSIRDLLLDSPVGVTIPRRRIPNSMSKNTESPMGAVKPLHV